MQKFCQQIVIVDKCWQIASVLANLIIEIVVQ